MSIQSTGLGDGERKRAVSPRTACNMLDVGMTRLYELIAAGEVDSYLDGRARKITVVSIDRRIARLLTATGHSPGPQPRRRGRPQKTGARVPLEAA